MPVETRNTRARDRNEQDNNRLRSRRRVESNDNVNEHVEANNEEEEEGFRTRRRRNRSQPRETGYQARGYRTRYLSAGDRNQTYLQEGIPEVAREYVYIMHQKVVLCFYIKLIRIIFKQVFKKYWCF